MNENCCNLIPELVKVIPFGPNWNYAGIDSDEKTEIALYTDAYMRHLALMN